MDMKPSGSRADSRDLREQERGGKTADVGRRHDIGRATFYKWKAEYGGLDVSDAKRLKVAGNMRTPN